MGIFTYSRMVSSVFLRQRHYTQNLFNPIMTPLLFSTPTSLRILYNHLKIDSVTELDETLMEGLKRIILEIVRIK